MHLYTCTYSTQMYAYTRGLTWCDPDVRVLPDRPPRISADRGEDGRGWTTGREWPGVPRVGKPDRVLQHADSVLVGTQVLELLHDTRVVHLHAKTKLYRK